jgi:C-terminal processing protease CtpA/Prc
LLVLASLPVTAAHRWSLEMAEPPEQAQTRMSMAVEVYELLETQYPHWSSANFTADELWHQYRDRLIRADRACGDRKEICASWLHAMEDMLAELENGHTDLLIEQEHGLPWVSVTLIEGQAVIRWVASGSDADSQGVVPGTIIRTVDGETVEAALARARPSRIAAVSPQTRVDQAYYYLLLGLPGTNVELEVDDGVRPLRRIVLRRDTVFPNGLELYEESTLYAETQPDGILSVYLDGFEGYDILGQLDEILIDYPDEAGLIIDLRRNGGGDPDVADCFLGRFWGEASTIGKHCQRVSEEEGKHEGNKCDDIVVHPIDSAHAGPLAVLIDRSSFSAAEIVASALCQSGRARCFGRPTAGETDYAIQAEVPGGICGVSVAEFIPADGRSLLGIGVQPHHSVAWTIDDVRNERDPDLEAALAWLRTQATSAASTEDSAPPDNSRAALSDEPADPVAG